MKLFNINKFTKTLIIAVIAVEMSLAGSSYAAPDDLVVEFESAPLFSEANFLPGNTVTKTAEVTNNTGGSREIIAEAINVTDPDDFAGVLNIVISEGESELYNDTLANFFGEGEVDLSLLAGSGGATTYSFAISFVAGSGNGYQENDLGFDIIIGFKGEGGDGGGGDDGGGGGGSGGGGGVPGGLSILNETVQVLDVETTNVTIVWDTSYRSTSRVVYGTEAGAFDFNDPPNYGYSFSTTEEDTSASSNGVFSHSVMIGGLTPGTTYYFRTISHASPDSVSFEKTFFTLGSSGQVVNVGGVTNTQGSDSGVNQDGQVAVAGSLETILGDSTDATSKDEDTEQLDDDVANEDNNNKEEIANKLVASIGGMFWPISWWWLLIFVVIVIVVTRMNKRSNK